MRHDSKRSPRPIFGMYPEQENRLHEVRLLMGLTVEELARRSQVQPTMISRLANGQDSPVFDSGVRVGQIRPYVHRIAIELGCSAEELFPRYFCIYPGIPEYPLTELEQLQERGEEIADAHLTFWQLARWVERTGSLTARRGVFCFYLYYGLDWTMTEIAAQLNTTKQNIALLLRKGRETLQHAANRPAAYFQEKDRNI